MPIPSHPGERRVFLSHSHRNREFATELQALLQHYGAQVFLDQDEIQVGDDLPQRIRAGVTRCDIFLLIWSAASASSIWVGREWDLAYRLRRRLIPYLIDRTPLPPGLDNLVFMDVSDRTLGDAKLLTSVFGSTFQPDLTTIFPGRWRLTIEAYGTVGGIYDINLRLNGQIEGEGGVNQDSQVFQMMRQLGLASMATMRILVAGSWSYDRNTQMLTLMINASGWGQQHSSTVKILVEGTDHDTLTGQDLELHTWTLRRLQ